MNRSPRPRLRIPARLALLAFCGLLPAVMGGCPDFRNESVTAVETASRGVLNAAVDLFFDQFRTDEFN